MTYLYRHFCAKGTLLYVGISLCALSRLYAHQKSPWFQQIRRVEIQRFKTRGAAEIAERKAIKNERPKYNKRDAVFIQIKKPGTYKQALSRVIGSPVVVKGLGVAIQEKINRMSAEKIEEIRKDISPAHVVSSKYKLSVGAIKRIRGDEIERLLSKEKRRKS